MARTLWSPPDVQEDPAADRRVRAFGQGGAPYSYSTLSEYRPETLEAFEARNAQAAEQRLAPLVEAAKAANVPCETVSVKSFSPYEAIIDTAGKYGCDVIFMASHGRRGLSAVLLGSETQKVLTHSKIPVLVYR